MSISVIVNGAFGRMGSLACEALMTSTKFNVVAKCDRKYDLLQAVKEVQADVVIDLTLASCVFENAKKILNLKLPAVIGSSGLTPVQIKFLQAQCAEQKLGMLIVPNFSIGAVLMEKLALQVERYFATVEIIETHHQRKQDAPSGTALRSAEILSQARSVSQGDEAYAGVRGGDINGVRVHSVRMPGVLAKQEMIFGQEGETLTLTHNVLNRDAYMPGLLLACEKVLGLSQLVVGLDQVLN